MYYVIIIQTQSDFRQTISDTITDVVRLHQNYIKDTIVDALGQYKRYNFKNRTRSGDHHQRHYRTKVFDRFNNCFYHNICVGLYELDTRAKVRVLPQRHSV